MMCGDGIRKLTGAERAARDEREALQYQRIASQVESEQRDEYEREFGPAYRAKFAFKPHNVHEEVMRRIRAEQVGL